MEEEIEKYNRLQKRHNDLCKMIPGLIKRREALHNEIFASRFKLENDLWKSIRVGDSLTNGEQFAKVYFIHNSDGEFMSRSYFHLDTPIFDRYNDKRIEIFRSWLNPIDGYLTNQGWKIIHKSDEHGK